MALVDGVRDWLASLVPNSRRPNVSVAAALCWKVGLELLIRNLDRLSVSNLSGSLTYSNGGVLSTNRTVTM